MRFLSFLVFASIFMPPNFLKFSWHESGHGSTLSLGISMLSLMYFFFLLIHVESILPDIGQLSDLFYWCFICFSSLPYYYDHHVLGVLTHEHVSMHFSVLWDLRSQLLVDWVMFIRVWLGNYITYRHSSCDEHGYVGEVGGGASLVTLGRVPDKVNV